ncbi:MAG: efflux RND transporter periplasmic adaptor subunit [Bacteroidales bacterium]|nr:efflux RND transporter periplasmic adaptor subunit [Bacteroidales bacterium]
MNKLSILVAALIGLWMLSGCGSPEQEAKTRIRPVKAMTIGDFNDPTGKGYPGVTKENQETEISFRIGGPIIKYNVVEGAQIKKGALIAEIDPRDYRIDVQSTKARFDQTKAESDRYYRLWKKGSVAKNDYDGKYANYLEAKADWDDAKNALKDTKLLAPYTGFFGPKLAQLGDKVMVRQAITTLVDLSILEVITTIPEQLAIQFLNFDSYEVRLETYPDIVFKASLKELEKKPTTEGFPLHLYLDHANQPLDETQIKVAAGMSCRVTIILKSASDEKSRIIIPLMAIFEGQLDKSTMVWLINTNDNTVKKQTVVAGDLIGHDGIQITGGLSIGEQIVIAGVHRLQEGDTVNNIDILEAN